MTTRVAAALLALVALPALARERGNDLAEVYPATLDYARGAPSRDWTVDLGDVWELTSFAFEMKGRFEVALGPSSVVFGRHGTNVMWAVVTPEKGGAVTSTEGGEEQVASIFLRFHPARVSEIFPKETVGKNGDPRRIYPAKRIYWARINDWNQVEAAPLVPERPWILVDIDTTAGGRHMFIVNTGAGTAKHYGGKAVAPPPERKISPADAVKAFDRCWKEFDRTYAKFSLLPDVDWDALRKKYRGVAKKSRTRYEAGGAIALLLAHLRDLHVWVSAGGEGVPVWYRPRTLNANWRATKALVGSVLDTGKDVSWGKTEDGIGYVNVWKLARKEAVAAFDEVLEKLADTWALVVDLRFNGGGGEDLALDMAGRIVAEERVYSKNQYRSGPKHDQLGEVLDRVVRPRGPWRYRSPVVVLQGQKTFSSAESFALMLKVCPQVTSLGDRTGGSSANPRHLELPGDIVVNLPRWNDMDPEGNPIENAGAKPEVRVEATLAEFRSRDPVMEAALERLREIPEADRKPGKR